MQVEAFHPISPRKNITVFDWFDILYIQTSLKFMITLKFSAPYRKPSYDYLKIGTFSYFLYMPLSDPPALMPIISPL